MKVNRVKLRPLVDITLTHEPEETSPKEHFEDKDALEWVQNQREAGNPWAWCSVCVRGSYRGLEAYDYLGACSYESRAAFKQCDYYESMVNAVVEEIAEKLEEMINVHGLWENDGTLCFFCLAEAS